MQLVLKIHVTSLYINMNIRATKYRLDSETKGAAAT